MLSPKYLQSCPVSTTNKLKICQKKLALFPSLDNFTRAQFCYGSCGPKVLDDVTEISGTGTEAKKHDSVRTCGVRQ